MAKKSDTIVLDVLHKNEAKHDDTLDIMRIQQSYLKPHLDVTGLSGDQLTCERQRCVKRHIMDGDTAKEPLDYLERLDYLVYFWNVLRIPMFHILLVKMARTSNLMYG